MTLETIDTSCWLTKDMVWMQARKDAWPSIETMLSKKNKKAISIIKQYYLKGKMPNWKALQEWENNERHLDLLCLLWLHPSNDEQLLYSLYREYMESELIYKTDAVKGYSSFVYSQIQVASSQFTTMDGNYFPYLDGKGLVIFNVLYKDIDFAGVQMRKQLKNIDRFKTDAQHLLIGGKLREIYSFGRWLALETILPSHKEWLLQYEEPLEWWYSSCVDEPTDYFTEKTKDYDLKQQLVENTYKALYRIHHFDTEREGDTCRTRFVYKVRKILDEREFIEDFKKMWLDVKAGNVEVEEP